MLRCLLTCVAFAFTAYWCGLMVVGCLLVCTFWCMRVVVFKGGLWWLTPVFAGLLCDCGYSC